MCTYQLKRHIFDEIFSLMTSQIFEKLFLPKTTKHSLSIFFKHFFASNNLHFLISHWILNHQIWIVIFYFSQFEFAMNSMIIYSICTTRCSWKWNYFLNFFFLLLRDEKLELMMCYVDKIFNYKWKLITLSQFST